jgi:hypothetical protein
VQKGTKHEFWVKWGGLGVFVLKIQLEVVTFQKWPERPSGWVSHEFCQPKPKMRRRTKHEFCVKWGGFVRSFQKIQLQVFSFERWGAGFAEVLSTESESAKTHQT